MEGYPVIIKNIENTTELQIGDRKDQYGSPVSSYISGWQIFGEDLPQNYVVADARAPDSRRQRQHNDAQQCR